MDAAAARATDALPSIPRDDEGPVFREPWEAQAFAMALSLHERGLFTWPEWAAALADEIKRAQAAGDPDTGETYYRHWLATLETAGRREGRRHFRRPASLSRRLGSRRRPHAARHADRIEAGGFSAGNVTRERCRCPAQSSHFAMPIGGNPGPLGSFRWDGCASCGIGA